MAKETSKGKRRRDNMTDAHKAALAKGREEGRAVRLYLEALESTKPRPGRRRSTESIEERLAALSDELTKATPLKRLHLIQEQRDLVAQIQHDSKALELSALEDGFVAAAKAYGKHKGIDYASWRSAGVSAVVLQRAGISRRAPD